MARIETLLFLATIVLLAFLISLRASRRAASTGGFFVAESSIGPAQNGMAIAGDFLSAAAFLGILGATAITGLPGFYVALSVPTTFVLMALLVAEPLRNLGRFTVSDMLAARFEGPGLRAVAAVNALVVSGIYMIAQFVGAGLLVSLLLGISYPASLIVVGVLMTFYVLLGGMVAVTWIQVFKTGLLLFSGLLLFALTLARFDGNLGRIFTEAVAQLGPRAVTPPHPATFAGSLDYVSLALGVAIGPVGLPHVLIRFLTVKDSRAARQSIVVASWIISGFLAMIAFIGLGASVILGRAPIVSANPAGTLATPMLAQALGGSLLLAFVSAVIFATTIAVIAGVAISASGTFAHDLYASVLRKTSGERERLLAARIAAGVVCLLAILASLGAVNLNLAYIGTIGMAIAASGNVPVILLTIFWKGFTRQGAVLGLIVGPAAAMLCILLGPTVLGDAALFPLANVGIVSIPVGFAAAVAGGLLGQRRTDEDARFEQIALRAAVTS